MSETVIGTCSLCGGPVTVPSPWLGILPPTPTCKQCGAVKSDHGPTIEMRPSKEIKKLITTDNTGNYVNES